MTDVEENQRVGEINEDPDFGNFNMEETLDETFSNVTSVRREGDVELRKNGEEETYYTFDEALDKIGFGIFQVVLMVKKQKKIFFIKLESLFVDLDGW